MRIVCCNSETVEWLLAFYVQLNHPLTPQLSYVLYCCRGGGLISKKLELCSTWLTVQRVSQCTEFSNLATAVSGSSNLFGAVPNNLVIWWRVVQCDGNEANIAFCPFQLNNNRCTHQQDAGVYCLGNAAASTSTPMPSQLSTSTQPPKICKLQSAPRS